MSGMGDPVRRRFAWLVLALLSASTLAAQQWNQTGLERSNIDARYKVIVGGRTGGHGYIIVDLENRGDRPRSVRFTHEAATWIGVEAGGTREGTLGPRERDRWFVPVSAAEDIYSTCTLSSSGEESREGCQLGRSNHSSVLVVSGESGARANIGAWTDSNGEFSTISSEELPPDWTMLSTFRAVLIDPSASVDRTGQELLRRYTMAGGCVIAVGHGEGLRAGGVLRERYEFGKFGRLGFGRFEHLSGYENARSGEQFSDLVTADARLAATVPSMLLTMDLPGLGEVPVRTFLVVIIAFAIVLGPVNFAFLKRRRRPLLALVTVPMIGFTTMFGILAYGVLHDGLGIKGVRWSASILDQRGHEAIAASSRTMFSGMSVGDLSAPAGTMIDSIDALESGRRSGGGARIFIDSNSQTYEGSIVPSRTLANITTTQVGSARDRLRFQQAGDGPGYRLLTGEGYVPRQGTSLVLRDFSGQWFVGEGGEMVPCSQERGEEALAGLIRDVALLPAKADRRIILDGKNLIVRQRNRIAELTYTLVPAGGLQPGSYVGVFDSLPWMHEFGLEVDWLDQVHLVLGQLSEEDIVS